MNWAPISFSHICKLRKKLHSIFISRYVNYSNKNLTLYNLRQNWYIISTNCENVFYIWVHTDTITFNIYVYLLTYFRPIWLCNLHFLFEHSHVVKPLFYWYLNLNLNLLTLNYLPFCRKHCCKFHVKLKIKRHGTS